MKHVLLLNYVISKVEIKTYVAKEQAEEFGRDLLK